MDMLVETHVQRMKASNESNMSMYVIFLRFEASYLEQLIALSKIFVQGVSLSMS